MKHENDYQLTITNNQQREKYFKHELRQSPTRLNDGQVREKGFVQS